MKEIFTNTSKGKIYQVALLDASITILIDFTIIPHVNKGNLQKEFSLNVK